MELLGRNAKASPARLLGLSANENRNQEYVSYGSSHWGLWSSAESGE